MLLGAALCAALAAPYPGVSARPALAAQVDTPTLPSPPAGGGVVIVNVLNVHFAPNADSPRVRILLYGESCLPHRAQR